MAKSILVRYGEISLKGKNRIKFENKLIDNIKKAVECRVKRIPGRFIINLDNQSNIDEQIKNLKKVFGIISLSIAEKVDLDLDKINDECFKQAKAKKFSTFRIKVQRLYKKLKTSPEIEREVGAYIVKKTSKKVKLKNPDLTLFIEIVESAYIFTEKIKCHGGLPTGIEGNVILLLGEGIGNSNSVLAGILMMRRGCDLYPFSFGGKISKNDWDILESYGSKPINIVKDMDELEKEARKKACRAVVVGQTLDNFSEIKTNFPILRPLIVYDEKEINVRLDNFRK
ncbi:THUMP domain-containing protein [candidate division KSB1 bacterium]